GGYDWHIQKSLADGEKPLYYLLRFNALEYLTRERPKNKAGSKEAAPQPSKADQRSHPLNRRDFGRSSENVLAELNNGPALAINMTEHLRRLRAAVEKAYPDRMEDITFYPTRSGQKED